jgi:hypothetical protein
LLNSYGNDMITPFKNEHRLPSPFRAFAATISAVAGLHSEECAE